MRRAVFTRQLQTVRRLARLEVQAALGGSGAVAAGAAQTAAGGIADANTGEFAPFGLVEITTLAEGFRVAGPPAFYGRVGHTPLSAFRVTP